MIFPQYDIREVKKKKKKLDGLSPTYLKPPPPPAPPKNGLCFFFSPLFYRSFPIFRHNFYIKSIKKNVKSWTRPETPPPHCGLSPSNFFLNFFLLPLVWI